MKIINAKVYTEEGIFEKKDVYTDGELISGMVRMSPLRQWQCMRHLRELPPLFRQP